MKAISQSLNIKNKRSMGKREVRERGEGIEREQGSRGRDRERERKKKR